MTVTVRRAVPPGLARISLPYPALNWIVPPGLTQNNLNMPCEPGMEDSGIVELRLRQLEYDRDQVAVELARKELEMFDLGV